MENLSNMTHEKSNKLWIQTKVTHHQKLAQATGKLWFAWFTYFQYVHMCAFGKA